MQNNCGLYFNANICIVVSERDQNPHGFKNCSKILQNWGLPCIQAICILAISVSAISILAIVTFGNQYLGNCTFGNQYSGNWTNTVAPRLLHTPSREERRFLNFNHLSKEFLEQMIPHLKALIQGVQNLQKNWLWHHLEGGQAPLTEKVLLLLELVWSLS